MVSDGKKLVANAITGKGVATSSSDTFATMANNISAIPQLDTSDANATAAQILSGYTAYVKGSKVSGSMTNRGAVTSSLKCGASYTIPAGYHNGSGKVTANSLASQTSATATAAQILSGYTAWANGNKLTGTASGAKTRAVVSGNSDWSGTILEVSSFNGSRVTIHLNGIAYGMTCYLYVDLS